MRTFGKSTQLSENKGKERRKTVKIRVFEGAGSTQLLPQNRENPAVCPGRPGDGEFTLRGNGGGSGIRTHGTG